MIGTRRNPPVSSTPMYKVRLLENGCFAALSDRVYAHNTCTVPPLVGCLIRGPVADAPKPETIAAVFTCTKHYFFIVYTRGFFASRWSLRRRQQCITSGAVLRTLSDACLQQHGSSPCCALCMRRVTVGGTHSAPAMGRPDILRSTVLPNTTTLQYTSSAGQNSWPA